MKQKTHKNSKYSYVIDKKQKHLGGNIHGGDPNCWTPKLWNWLNKKFEIKTVLDVGCGEGHTLKYFKSLGCIVIGVDGLRENVDNSIVDGITCLDLTKQSFSISTVDLVWCCEVVEHIEERYIGYLLKALVNGRIIAMTHAEPGQEGYHHVNCKPAKYWIELMDMMGYDILIDETNIGRSKAGKKATGRTTFFSQTGLIFKRR